MLKGPSSHCGTRDDGRANLSVNFIIGKVTCVCRHFCGNHWRDRDKACNFLSAGEKRTSNQSIQNTTLKKVYDETEMSEKNRKKRRKQYKMNTDISIIAITFAAHR